MVFEQPVRVSLCTVSSWDMEFLSILKLFIFVVYKLDLSSFIFLIVLYIISVGLQ
jgi:hypothetical protein